MPKFCQAEDDQGGNIKSSWLFVECEQRYEALLHRSSAETGLAGAFFSSQLMRLQLAFQRIR
jgi:hypothetical protein